MKIKEFNIEDVFYISEIKDNKLKGIFELNGISTNKKFILKKLGKNVVFSDENEKNYVLSIKDFNSISLEKVAIENKIENTTENFNENIKEINYPNYFYQNLKMRRIQLNK